MLDDGVILRSEASLIASMQAEWAPRARAAASRILDRIAAEESARTTREIRTAPAPAGFDLDGAVRDFGVTVPFGAGPGRDLVLHCPAERTFALVEALTRAGAQTVTVAALEYVFRTSNPLAERLTRRIGPDSRPNG